MSKYGMSYDIGNIIGPLGFMVIMVGYFLFVVCIAFPAIDRQEEARLKQFKIDKALCEAKGGVAVQSSWDGQLKDCKL